MRWVAWRGRRRARASSRRSLATRAPRRSRGSAWRRQGAWSEAEAELQAASGELEATRPGNLSHALIRLGELRRRQGRLDEAEALLQRVAFIPHASFGLAAVALDRGRPAEALDLVHRFLRQIASENRTARAAAFELAVRAHSALGRADAAGAALAELRALAESVATDALRASVALAQGVVTAAAGEYATSRGDLEDAVDLLERAGAPFEAAEARLELANVLTGLGQERLAAREARVAHDSSASLGAALLARRAAALLRRLGTAAGSGRKREITTCSSWGA